MTRHTTAAPRPRTGEIPRELLERGREMAGFGRDIWLAGLGALAVVGEETTGLFDRLVESGEDFEKRGRRELTTRQRELSEALDERVYEPVMSGLRRLGVPTRGEMHDLAGKVDRLARKVDALVTHVTGQPPEDDARRNVRVYKVVAGPEGWEVDRDGEPEPVGTWSTKEEALDEARALAQKDTPSRLDVYRKDGTLQDTLTF
jgi:polyhydroxyalkanoate synthesis regulator phasin